MKKEIFVAIGILVLAGFCIFYSMTPMMYVGVHALAIALFILFALLIWRGTSHDERESQHKAVASDIAFTVGGTLLAIAMIYQISVDMKIDVWLMVVLGGMIFARVLARMWLNENN